MTNPTVTSILLVEDDIEDAFLVRKAIESAPWGQTGILSHHVQSAAAAKEALSEKSYDVILSDLFMPDTQDLSIVTDLHQLAPQTPIIVLTGHNDDTMAKRSLKMGAQDYLVKGQFDGRMLVRVIQYAIERMNFEVERTRLASFPELDPNPILEFDPARRVVTYANPAAKKLLSGLVENQSHAILEALSFVAKRALNEQPQTALTGKINYNQNDYYVNYHALKFPRVIRIYFLSKEDMTKRDSY